MSTRPAAATVQSSRSRSRRAGLPFIIGGGALALLTFVGVIFYTTSLTGAGAGNVAVVVAARDLPIRVPILPADVTVAQFHAEDVPPGAFSKITDVTNVVAGINISKGQPITSNLVVSSSDSVIGPQAGFLPIPTGFVALTIPTGEQIGVAGYIQVGDYISLVAAVPGKGVTNIRTVYTNIPVIRIGSAPPSVSAATPGTNPTQTGGLTTSLTIVVTQCQAEYISWFTANASLRYTLESYKDYQPQDKNADPSCPSVTSAKGVTAADIAKQWPGLLG